MPENWLHVARDARKSASTLLTEDHYRSAAARAYYAAYSKITHELVAIGGLPMPPGREGPGHGRIRAIIETSMPNMAQAKRDKHQRYWVACTRFGLTRTTGHRVPWEAPKLGPRFP